MKVIALKVRTWAAQQVFDHDMPEEFAREILLDVMHAEVDQRGYEPAPGYEPTFERYGRLPWQQTLMGQLDGEWIGHPDDYGLIGKLRVRVKGYL